MGLIDRLRLNLTPRRIQQLVAEGVIPRPEKGK
jgi:hypothetical protein